MLLQFSATAANGLLIQPCDLRNLSRPSISESRRFQCRDPPPLRFIQPLQHGTELQVPFLLWMDTLSTQRTFALRPVHGRDVLSAAPRWIGHKNGK